MAEAIVSLAVERLADLIIHEANFLQGVDDEVEQLKVQLERMRCLLKDADRRQDQDHRVQNWVAEIRNLAYDAEDVIDTFLTKIIMARRQSFIKKALSMFSKPFNLLQIKTQINHIKDKLANISTSMQTYGIKLVSEGEESSIRERQRRLRRAYPHMEEEYVISFDSITRELKTQVTKKEDRLCVLSIVGMGGIGKTTLARKVFNDAHMKQHFDCYCWIFISQHFSIKDLITGILMQVMTSEDKSSLEEEQEDEKEISSKKKKEDKKKFRQEKFMEERRLRSVLDKMKEDELVVTLHKVLEEKRYFVVLDDIWTKEAWDCLTPAFPKGKNGSKVLLTTRNREVAAHADPLCPPIEPTLLSIDEGWELLSRKAFVEHGYSPEFKMLGRKMVEKCGGLPLAIVVLGGLLATKKSVKEWEVVQRSVNAQFTKLDHDQQYGGVYGILSMSYDDLPFHLKPCFLYLSHFYEDLEFHKRRLIRLWIAEGFVSQPQVSQNDRTIEEVGEEYLKELVSRCMVQVSQMDHTGVGLKTCRLHDLVRDVCISKARDENFLLVVEHVEDAGKFRRIAIHSHHSGIEDVRQNAYPHLRSFLYFDVGGDEYYGKFVPKNYKLLRVLYLENIKQIPREIEILIHLRYLGLKKCGFITSIGFSSVASIGNLRSLYTLDLREMGFERLPNDVLGKLECLRHLLVDRSYDSVGFVSLDNLRHLETLKWINAKSLIWKNAFQQLINLRNLGVVFDNEEEIQVVLESPIFRLGRLNSLHLVNDTISSVALESLSGCQRLTKLKLVGPINGNIECLPTSLAKLILLDSKLEQDPMEKLAKLPNLRVLSLENGSYRGFKMVCSARGFPRLETLELRDLFELKEWEIEEDAMPCLNTLGLYQLYELKTIPEGLKFVTTVQDLKIKGMKSIRKRVDVRDGIEGEDFHKVRHIPSISFTLN